MTAPGCGLCGSPCPPWHGPWAGGRTRAFCSRGHANLHRQRRFYRRQGAKARIASPCRLCGGERPAGTKSPYCGDLCRSLGRRRVLILKRAAKLGRDEADLEAAIASAMVVL
jgi:hypothetical protein